MCRGFCKALFSGNWKIFMLPNVIDSFMSCIVIPCNWMKLIILMCWHPKFPKHIQRGFVRGPWVLNIFCIILHSFCFNALLAIKISPCLLISFPLPLWSIPSLSDSCLGPLPSLKNFRLLNNLAWTFCRIGGCLIVRLLQQLF